MKITLDWLREHLDGDYSVADVVATLNRIGHEVEGVENPAEKLAGFRVAKVLTAERHPQADKLQVLTVDAGDGAAQQVKAIFAAEVEVEQQAVVDAALQPVTGCIQIGDGIEARARACDFRAQAQQALADQRLILDDQYAHVSSIRLHQSAPSAPWL